MTLARRDRLATDDTDFTDAQARGGRRPPATTSEGQAATSQAKPEDAVESPSADQTEGAPGPVRSELDKTMSDQDIDTAGTDADKA